MPFIRSFDDYEDREFENGGVGNDFLFLDAKSGRYHPLNYFSVLTEERLFDSVKRHGVKYIVLYKYRMGLRDYFSGNPNFLQVGGDYGDRFVVYAVQDELVHHGFDRVILPKALRLLRESLKERPHQFEGYINDFFKPVLNIDRDKLGELISLE